MNSRKSYKLITQYEGSDAELGEVVHLSNFGEYCPNNSLRGYKKEEIENNPCWQLFSTPPVTSVEETNITEIAKDLLKVYKPNIQKEKRTPNNMFILGAEAALLKFCQPISEWSEEYSGRVGTPSQSVEEAAREKMYSIFLKYTENITEPDLAFLTMENFRAVINEIYVIQKPKDIQPNGAGYEALLDEFLNNGIDYSVKPLQGIEIDDLMQFASDCHHRGFQDATNAMQHTGGEEGVIQDLKDISSYLLNMEMKVESDWINNVIKKLSTPSPLQPSSNVGEGMKEKSIAEQIVDSFKKSSIDNLNNH